MLQRSVIGGAQGMAEKPAWCKQLSRSEYAKLERVPIADTWFEVYKVAPYVFAIYEPHQSEETIGYLIVGDARALLFDTGMGIGDLKALAFKLSQRPIIVLNSHTHDDHVGDNWQFHTVYGMDTEFTRRNRRVRRKMRRRRLRPARSAVRWPPGSIARRTGRGRGGFRMAA
jgi:glyoxylase-like metal-dependent hydrolase (beta-lactamase superfamily II)